MSTTALERRHYLYRVFDADGSLLYVGISADPDARIESHRRSKPWWPEVASATLEEYPSGDAVAAAEALAIATEQPRYNVRPGSAVDVRIFREPGVGKPSMVKRSFFIQRETWEQAKALAAEDPRPGGANISDIARDLFELYVKKGGRL